MMLPKKLTKKKKAVMLLFLQMQLVRLLIMESNKMLMIRNFNRKRQSNNNKLKKINRKFRPGKMVRNKVKIIKRNLTRIRIMVGIKLMKRVRKINRRQLKLNHNKIKRVIMKEDAKNKKDKRRKLVSSKEIKVKFKLII